MTFKTYELVGYINGEVTRITFKTEDQALDYLKKFHRWHRNNPNNYLNLYEVESTAIKTYHEFCEELEFDEALERCKDKAYELI